MKTVVLHLVWTRENGGFRKRLRHLQRFLKTEILYPSVDAQKRRFSKAITIWLDIWHLHRWSNVDGQKRCKKVSVDETLFICFQETDNGGFRKRISVDRATV